MLILTVMERKPSESEIRSASQMILNLFVITEKEATAHAEGLLNLAYGWGKPMELEKKIKRRLGTEYKWRSDYSKKEFEREEKASFAGYESYIQNKKRKP
ncbi:hypothetical protein QEH52_18585 [Coraliomargarita sp. SDUM461003]|uniref:Uncharacterized protein n=1 Tax=Thalassobacterium maritimum TaxID=3041265 RepID=A0ABU1AZF9_9BACT|nr:hypothetical protein [Coraliomargarita sp. SDUM461003]MDQ8209539.1 hypothetical protein [Coraliomargarita sp. SDUM461003]